ncbi:hypothetical protein BYT27DRAFT_7206132 [Phlegmacium glaucopus]|nr:hypothetical protein BYT27DRAFT_7206132 [Phlegmacium glaucopus]
MATSMDALPSPYQANPKYVQEVILYCASRFRAIAVATDKMDETMKIAVQNCLITELLFALSYIGMAAAIGQPIDIPIIIRAMACNFYQNGPESITILFDREFHLALDARSDPDDLAATVPSYHLQWWASETTVQEMDVLSVGSIDDCLKYHRDITGIKGLMPERRDKTKYTWLRDLNMDPLALGVLDDLQDMRHFFHGMEVTFEGCADATARRAASFQQLYEAAIMKELQGESTKGSDETGQEPGVSGDVNRGTTSEPAAVVGDQVEGKVMQKQKWPARRQANKIRAEAKEKLVELQNVLALLWRWGTTEGSCYDPSIVILSPPGGTHKYSDIGEDISLVPELTPRSHPVHFAYPPLCHDYRDPAESTRYPTVQQSTTHLGGSTYMTMPVMFRGGSERREGTQSTPLSARDIRQKAATHPPSDDEGAAVATYSSSLDSSLAFPAIDVTPHVATEGTYCPTSPANNDITLAARTYSSNLEDVLAQTRTCTSDGNTLTYSDDIAAAAGVYTDSDDLQQLPGYTPTLMTFSDSDDLAAAAATYGSEEDSADEDHVSVNDDAAHAAAAFSDDAESDNSIAPHSDSAAQAAEAFSDCEGSSEGSNDCDSPLGGLSSRAEGGLAGRMLASLLGSGLQINSSYHTISYF